MKPEETLTQEEKSLLGQISHISATPEFTKNPENLKLLAKIVKGANAKPAPELFDAEMKGASFSNDRKYRYSLWRIWDKSKPLVMFIGLNPSTANENSDDPTIRSVCRIANNNGYGGIYMLNCWAYISTDPKLIKHNPMSDEWNNNVLIVTAGKCKDVVFAWGDFNIVKDTGRVYELSEMFPRAMALHINKKGSPKHPLYCKSDTKLIPFLTI